MLSPYAPHNGFRRFKSVAREGNHLMTLQAATICKGCWQQMHMPIPLRGVLSVPFRAFGIRPSRMNPNICTICEMMFERAMKARTVMLDATILFADLRAYTKLSQSMSPIEMRGVLDAFYDRCASAIWHYDGLLNKTIGDAVMAVFNFPIRRADHARQALLAAREMQRTFEHYRAEHAEGLARSGIGVGIHTGEISFGEFGQTHRDLTAIGTVVNTASRAQTAAEPGQILVTEAVFEKARSELRDSTVQEYQLKGFDEPIRLYRA
jgi:adenylate cyclase